MKRGRYMYVPNPVHACDGFAACMTFNSQLTIIVFVNAMARNLNTKSLVVLAMSPRKQKTVESGGIGLMSDGGEAHSVPFPIWRKFINRLALAEIPRRYALWG